MLPARALESLTTEPQPDDHVRMVTPVVSAQKATSNDLPFARGSVTRSYFDSIQSSSQCVGDWGKSLWTCYWTARPLQMSAPRVSLLAEQERVAVALKRILAAPAMRSTPLSPSFS